MQNSPDSQKYGCINRSYVYRNLRPYFLFAVDYSFLWSAIRNSSQPHSFTWVLLLIYRHHTYKMSPNVVFIVVIYSVLIFVMITLARSLIQVKVTSI